MFFPESVIFHSCSPNLQRSVHEGERVGLGQVPGPYLHGGVGTSCKGTKVLISAVAQPQTCPPTFKVERGLVYFLSPPRHLNATGGVCSSPPPPPAISLAVCATLSQAVLKGEVQGVNVRDAIRPPPGRLLISADYSMVRRGGEAGGSWWRETEGRAEGWWNRG